MCKGQYTIHMDAMGPYYIKHRILCLEKRSFPFEMGPFSGDIGSFFAGVIVQNQVPHRVFGVHPPEPIHT